MSQSLAGLGVWLSQRDVAYTQTTQTTKKMQIRGAYGSPKSFWEKGKRLND